MRKHIWLQKQEKVFLRLNEFSLLFGQLKQAAVVSAIDRIDQVAAVNMNDGVDQSDRVRPTDQPVILLQERAVDEYCLQRESVNAGLLRYRQLSQEQMEQRWQAARLRTDAELSDERLYFVQCIDHSLLCWCRVDAALKPIGKTHTVLRDAQGMILHDGQELSELTLRALETAAARALYALWLDVGSVLIAVSGTGSLAIRRAWSIEQGELPYERESLESALHDWLERWEADVGQAFLLGADPELVLVDQNNKLVAAPNLLLDMMSEEIGIDALLYKKKLIYPIIELRPRPVRDPARLIAVLHYLLGQLHQQIAERPLRLLAGGMPVHGVALGGHLHISGIPLTPRLLRMLDVMLALPFAALADESGKARNRKFGGLGDFRKQFHGGFEYRTLPSWLVSPALAKAAIYTCWLTIRERLALVESLRNLMSVEDAYIHGAKAEQYIAAQEYVGLLSTVARDGGLAEKLKPLQRALELRRGWDEAQDIRQRWRVEVVQKTGL